MIRSKWRQRFNGYTGYIAQNVKLKVCILILLFHLKINGWVIDKSTNISTDCYWAVCFHFLISCILHSSAWASLADNQTCTALHCTDRTYVVRPMSHKQLLKPTKLCSLQKAVVFILIAFIGATSGTLCLQNCVYFYIFISPAILSKNSW